MFCTRAHVRTLMTQKSCAVGMRNAKLGNHPLKERLKTNFKLLAPKAVAVTYKRWSLE